MRTIVQEATPQIPLRNCSEGGWGRVSRHVILVKGVYMHSSPHFRRRFLLDTRNRCHHEGFWYFSSSEEVQELRSENLLWEVSI